MSAFEEEDDAGCVCKVNGITYVKGTDIFVFEALTGK